MLKICTKCGQEKPATIEHFHKSRGGLRSACKDCIKRWREENKEDISKKNKNYREKNSEKIKEYKRNYQKEQYHKIKKYRRNNAEKIREQQQKYQQNYRNENKDYLSKQRKNYYHKNKGLISERNKLYVEKNKEKIKEYKRNWARNKTKTDLHYRMAVNLRSRLNTVLNRIKNKVLKGELEVEEIKKHDSTLNFLGCSLDFLKLHLERKFDNEMTWANYGTYWHVDHIRPCASFDLANHEQQKTCFHWTNLQPLEAKENLKKGAKWG